MRYDARSSAAGHLAIRCGNNTRRSNLVSGLRHQLITVAAAFEDSRFQAAGAVGDFATGDLMEQQLWNPTGVATRIWRSAPTEQSTACTNAAASIT